MDVVNRILGTPPKRVWATGGIDYWRDGREAEDNVFCTYEYALTDPAKPDAPYTVRATWSAILNNAFEGASELIMGTKGSLLITRNKCLLYQEGAGVPDAAAGSGNPDGADAVTSGKTLAGEHGPLGFPGRADGIRDRGRRHALGGALLLAACAGEGCEHDLQRGRGRGKCGDDAHGL